MAFARVVSFEGVSKERIEQLKSEISSDQPPVDIPAKELLMLYDPDSQKSLVVMQFDTEEDYKRGDAALNAMPSDDTPGQRTSVARYEVAMRMTM